MLKVSSAVGACFMILFFYWAFVQFRSMLMAKLALFR